jgi:hypothetical protein
MANSCDDIFQQLQELERRDKELRDQLSANQLRLAQLKSQPDAPTPQIRATFRTADGKLLELTDTEVDRFIPELLSQMDTPEIEGLVARSLGEMSTPMGINGRFENYRRLIAQFGRLENVEDLGKITEALWSTWKKVYPNDYGFVTKSFGQEQATALANQLAGEFGGSSAAARAAIDKALNSDAAGFLELPERKVQIRFSAEAARYNLAEELRIGADALEAIPGRELPPTLKSALWEAFKVTMALERQDRFANRQVALALKSQQFGLDSIQRMRLDTTEAAAELTMRPADVQSGSFMARIMEAVYNRDSGALRELAKIAQADGIDPKNILADGWQNPHLRYSIALSKDSQLTSLRPQLISNTGGGLMMNIYGPVRTWFENVGYLAHHGSSWNRALLEGLQTAWRSHRVAMDMTRASAKELMSDAFYSGKILYGGNDDYPNYGKTYNDELLAQVQATFNQPLIPRGPDGGMLSQPQILARMIGKLQAGPRLLLFEKTGSQHHWLLTPGFRGMAAADNVSGHHAYVFGTRNDLELRARIGDAEPRELLKDKSQADRLPTVDEEGNTQLSANPLRPDEFFDLSNPAERQAWIDRELADSFYSKAPTEQEVIDYRRANGIKGFDMTDDEIKVIISNQRAGDTYAAPNLSNRSAIKGQQYSDFVRMQHEQEGVLGHIDQAMVSLRRHWAIDAAVPYWRAPFNAFLFDTTLGFPPLMRTIELWSRARNTPGGWKSLPAQDVARVQAGWATSGVMLGLFAGLDAAGLVIGNGPADANEKKEWLATLKGKKPNSIGGVQLSGLPVFNTLFLWKDLKDAAAAGAFSNFDANTFYSVVQVLTSQVVRQTGFAQLRQIFEVLTSGGEKRWGDFVGFMGTGLAQPFVGLERSMQLVTGSGANNFYQPRRGPGDKEWMLPPDDPFEQLRSQLNDMAYKLEPGAWASVAWLANMGAGSVGMKPPIGDRRITEDMLGNPIRFPYGTPLSFLEQHPAMPGVHPEGDKKLYAELDAQNLLVPPRPLRERQLDGVAMSPPLQKEYHNYFTRTTGPGMLPLTGRLGLADRSLSIGFPIYYDVRANIGGQGVSFKDGETVRLDLGPFLDKHVKGKTVLQAMRSLLNDPIYKNMQDDPALTNDPKVRDMPPSERRRKAASVMIRGIYEYYELLANDRLRGSSTPAAIEWREKHAAIGEQERKDSLKGLPGFARAINGAAQ